MIGSAVIGQNVLGLGLALLLGRVNRATRAVVSTIVVAAWVLPEIVAAFAAYAYFADDGTLNQLLAGVGIDGPNWLFEFPMLAVILANMWRGTAFSMMVYEAALNDVPPEITEAAIVDGAGGLQRLVVGHAADDPRQHRHEPHAHHPADARGVHADLGDDQGRARHRQHDPADPRLPGGVQVPGDRLRIGDRVVMIVIGAVVLGRSTSARSDPEGLMTGPTTRTPALRRPREA